MHENRRQDSDDVTVKDSEKEKRSGLVQAIREGVEKLLLAENEEDDFPTITGLLVTAFRFRLISNIPL
jgi:hypothetical protein